MAYVDAATQVASYMSSC